MAEREMFEAGWDKHPVVGGIEIFVGEQADDRAARELACRGWRWSKSTQSWYHRDTPEAEEFAHQFCDELRPKPR